MPEPVTVSRHAMDRYREHVANVPDCEIFAALTTPTFELAVEPMVKLPGGHHAVLREDTVVTVLPADASVDALDRFSSPRSLPAQPPKHPCLKQHQR